MERKYHINRLFICNFKPFLYGKDEERPYLEINFRTLQEMTSSMVLSGPNGYGKTSIFQAICFTLTGMMSIGPYLDGRKSVAEHLVINDIEKPSFTALELWDKERHNYVTIIRYTPKGKASKISKNKGEAEQEAKDFNAYIIEGKFDYSCFIEGEKTVAVPSKISERLGEHDISEWIGRNYIQQDYERNILLQDKSTRVDFLNKFIEQETDKYFSNIETEIKNCTDQIKTLEKALQELKEQIGQEVKEATGKPPICEQVYPETDFSWDKSEYSEKDLFKGYIQDVDKLLVIAKHPEEYITCRKIELLDSILGNQRYFKQYILNLYSSEKINNYKVAYYKKAYWERLLQNEEELWNENIEHQYLEENLLEQIDDARTKRKEWKEALDDQCRLYEEIENCRNILKEKENIVQDTFKNVCPLCGSDFKERDMSLGLAIQNAGTIFEQAKKLLGNALSVEKQGWKEKELLIKSQLKKLAEKENVNRQTYLDIENSMKMASLTEKMKIQLQEFNKLSKDTQLKKFSDEEMFQNECKDIEEYGTMANNLIAILTQLKKQLEIDQINIDKSSYETFKENLAKLNEVGYRVEKLENKKTYLEWQERKKKALEYSEKKDQFDKKLQELEKLYIKQCKLNKVLSCQGTARKQYLHDLLNHIEIPFYIYSGKLIQTYQSGLGLFCHSGKDENQLTEFKIGVSKEGLDGQLDVTSKFSSGQKNVTNIALMMALKKIAKTNLDVFMVDDPCQSLDELNIASFVEIIKNEFKDTQLILSTHEERIAGYIKYKCEKAGKNIKLYDVQKEVYAMTTE